MRDGVAALLKPPERRNEEPTRNGSPSSEVEREVLETLRRTAGYHPSLRELRSKLLPLFTERQIQEAIMALLDKGLIQLVDGNGRGLFFKLVPPESYGVRFT